MYLVLKIHRLDVDTLQGRLGTFTEKTVEALEKLAADRRALQSKSEQLFDTTASLNRRLGFLSSNMTESQVSKFMEGPILSFSNVKSTQSTSRWDNPVSLAF